MMKFTADQTLGQITESLINLCMNSPAIMPGLYTIILRTDSVESNMFMLNSPKNVANAVYYGLKTDAAQGKAWHVFLDITPAGILNLTFTDQDDISAPDILELASIGSC